LLIVWLIVMGVILLQGKSQAEIIQGSYATIKSAFNDYVKVTNQGLSLELKPLVPIA